MANPLTLERLQSARFRRIGPNDTPGIPETDSRSPHQVLKKLEMDWQRLRVETQSPTDSSATVLKKLEIHAYFLSIDSMIDALNQLKIGGATGVGLYFGFDNKEHHENPDGDQAGDVHLTLRGVTVQQEKPERRLTRNGPPEQVPNAETGLTYRLVEARSMDGRLLPVFTTYFPPIGGPDGVRTLNRPPV